MGRVELYGAPEVVIGLAVLEPIEVLLADLEVVLGELSVAFAIAGLDLGEDSARRA